MIRLFLALFLVIGSHTTQIVDEVFFSQISWSPDGTAIAYYGAVIPDATASAQTAMGEAALNRDSVETALRTVDLAGNQTTIAQFEWIEPYTPPGWTPDGLYVVVSASKGASDGEGDIYLVARNGGSLINLTNSSEYEIHLAVSSKGGEIPLSVKAIYGR